ncbi:pre-mRNA cleavage complex 2 protein Pcf11 isoform X1 [Callorhinchus milii]|nr:pre-mRNA cleavage complex 2 protein Pcf11 isoform X1 [Callorhinchus milii]|eukprot:gi/632937752/ref/XP_007900906.1/ PREDICTED: pre-mRNA cleavage complex 2 protein Pcf11 isoform X1 [Callorhinchus milii]
MAEEAAAKADACKEYQSSLEDLTFNSKPHINNLTILAEENLKYSSEIVKLIEAQITKASTSEKLPIMYLMDSIVKNVGGSYISLFAQNIVSTFACVFEKVDESTRKSLFKLRSTWDDMFPLKRLYALDVKVNKLDPAWPIKPLPPNVNSSSIHVNPKFLNRSLEESATSSPTVVTPVSSAKHNIAESQKNVIQEQEQFIRQQLLAKQKQLLELQQKKLELELEQTKAQLVASLASQQPDPGVSLGHSKQHVPITKVSPMLSSVTAKPTPAPIKPLQQTSAQPDKSQSMHAHDTKVSNRDPRINRLNQHSAQTKDPAKKDSLLQAEKFDKPANRTNSPTGEISANLKSENHTNTSKQEKDKSCDKSLKKVSEGKSKLLSPVKNKLSVKSAKKADSEKGKSEINRRDPRLRKSSQDKSDNKSEIKEKRRSAEKKVEEDHNKGTDRKSTPRNKTVNGTVLKHEKDGKEIEKDGSKSVGLNFRLRARSSRSQSPRSRSPISRFVRQRGRLSPKRRRTSVSPLSKTVPEKEKPVKKHDEKQNADNWEQDRKKTGKAEARDTRRSKRTREDRVQDPQGTRPETRNSPRMSPEPKENAENWHDPPSVKRWKSGWEEAKSLHQKQETSTRTKLTYQQQRDAHAGNKGVLSPRTPRQQRMSVDANLQIPKELTSANKRDLLRKANQRLANGEIGYEEFLVVAHQINQLFQYQEEKNRSSDSQWGGGKKLKGETSSARSQTKNAKLSEAEMSYYEHMAKLKRTRVQLEQLQDPELCWKIKEDLYRESTGDIRLIVKEGDDQGSRSPSTSSKPHLGSERHDTRDASHEKKVGEKRLSTEDARGHHSEGRHSDRRKLSEGKSTRLSPVGDKPDKHGDRVSSVRKHPSPSVEEEKKQTDKHDTINYTSETLPVKEVKSSEFPEDQVTSGNNWVESRTELQRQGSKHQLLLERELQEFGPRNRPDIKREETRSQCDHSEERSAFDPPPQRGDGLGENSRLRSGGLEISQRLRELTDGPGQSKPGNLERLRTDKSIEPEAWEAERPWLPGRDGSPKCDGRIAGSRMRLDNLPGPGVLQRIDGAPELSGLRVEGHAGQPGQRFEGSQPGQTISCFDNSQPGARFDGPSSHSGDPRLWVEGPTGRSGQSNFDGLGRHSGQPGVRFDNPDSPLGQSRMHFDVLPSGVRNEGARTLQPGMRFDNPDARLGQLGVRFDSPRPGHPSMRFDNPDVRIGQPGVRFDSPRPNLLGLRFDGPRSLQPGIRFDNPDSRMGQPGVRFDSPRAAQPGVRFDGSGIRPGQPGIRFDNAHQGQPGLRFDGPGNHPRQSGMRFDSPVGHQVQHGIRFDGPHPRHPGVHFDGNPGFRFGAAAGHFDGHLGPQFDRGAAQPDPRINVPGHLFNGHASSQFQGTVLTGQPGLRFNMAPGMHYNESPSHGGTMLGNSTYGLSGPCFDGRTPISQGLQGHRNIEPYDPANSNFYNRGHPTSLPGENTHQLPSVNTITSFPHNQPFSQVQQQYVPSHTSVIQVQQGLPFAPRENHLGQLDVNELFAKLLSTGILKANPTETIQTQGESQAQPAVEEEEEEEEEEDNEENIPDLTNFNIDELKQRYDSVINRLYTGIQCYSCGMRFTESQTDVYADHLDWHYRMNRMEKDITKKVTHRKWYYSLTDWIEFEEIADLEERAKSQFFEKVHEEVIQRTQEAAKEKEFQSVPAGPAGVQEICEICQEPFEQYWDEDEEEWHLKNAVRVEGRTYHPACYEDYKNASITDSTPSPSEAPIENPLHSIIGIVKQEKLDSCETLDSTISCKNEESEDSSMLTDIKTEIESDTAVVKLEKV